MSGRDPRLTLIVVATSPRATGSIPRCEPIPMDESSAVARQEMLLSGSTPVRQPARLTGHAAVTWLITFTLWNAEERTPRSICNGKPKLRLKQKTRPKVPAGSDHRKVINSMLPAGSRAARPYCANKQFWCLNCAPDHLAYNPRHSHYEADAHSVFAAILVSHRIPYPTAYSSGGQLRQEVGQRCRLAHIRFCARLRSHVGCIFAGHGQ